MTDLGNAQTELVAALTGSGPPPPGFDVDRLEIARKALLRKRSNDVSRSWPMLVSALGDRFPVEFVDWVACRPTVGAFRDGWDFARRLVECAQMPAAAAVELAEREFLWRYDGIKEPRRRRLPGVRIVAGQVLVRVGGRIRPLGRR